MQSLRGGCKIYKEVFADDEPKEHRKGRSKELIERRNECLVDRYFFYGRFTGVRYDLLIERVSNEFHLSIYTVKEIIDNNITLLKETKNRLKDVPFEKVKKELSQKWPYMVWNVQVDSSGL